MKVNFKIKKKNPDHYYSVNDFTFPKDDDVAGVLLEIVYEYDLKLLCSFLSEQWPLKYGAAVNLMIREGYSPENIEEEMAELNGLFNEDLFYALCKYPLNSISYFSDQFSAGASETDVMLQKVCDFINQDESLANNSNQNVDPDWDPAAALDDLMKEYDNLDNAKK
jgi:hypothetical protein